MLLNHRHMYINFDGLQVKFAPNCKLYRAFVRLSSRALLQRASMESFEAMVIRVSYDGQAMLSECQMIEYYQKRSCMVN